MHILCTLHGVGRRGRVCDNSLFLRQMHSRNAQNYEQSMCMMLNNAKNSTSQRRETQRRWFGWWQYGMGRLICLNDGGADKKKTTKQNKHLKIETLMTHQKYFVYRHRLWQTRLRPRSMHDKRGRSFCAHIDSNHTVTRFAHISIHLTTMAITTTMANVSCSSKQLVPYTSAFHLSVFFRFKYNLEWNTIMLSWQMK